jgi:formylglycine-generating enzyme required for sulfatase activity
MTKAAARALLLLWVPFASSLLAQGPSRPATRELTNSIGMRLVLVPAGEFLMGGTESVEAMLQAFPAYKVAAKTAYLFQDEYGNDPAALARQANVMDPAGRTEFPHVQEILMPRDGKFTLPAGSYPPNGFGLCDMYGNVWQWCADWYGRDYYSRSPVNDPAGPESGLRRVRRGGAWNSFPLYARASFRNWNRPDSRCVNLGFRVLREAQ